jgi:hypothetical protein
MQNISEYINEARADMSGPVEIEYTPRNREELIDAIIEVTKNAIRDRWKVLDFNCIDTKEVTDMTSVFPDAARSVKLLYRNDFKCDQWDVSNVTSFKDMFRNMHGFTGYWLDKWPVEEKCVNVEGMFAGTRIDFIDISGWRLNNVESINDMFADCEKLEAVVLPYGMRKLKSMERVFDGDWRLEQVTLPEVTGKIETLRGCFKEAGFVPFYIFNLDKLKCSNNADLKFMFAYASPRVEDVLGFVKANNLGYSDCKDFGIEKTVMMDLEAALKKRS